MKSSGLTFLKIIILVLVLFAIVVIGYQIYKYNFVFIKTESAIMGEMEKVVKTNGIFIRDEKVINQNDSQFIDVVRTEGERVAAGGVIARVYSDENSAKVQNKIRELKKKIDTYQEVLSNSGSYQNASKGIEQEICGNLIDIAKESKAGKPSAFVTADSLTIGIMKKKIASGDLVQYDTVLNGLRAELKQLEASSGASVKTIQSSESGYFSFGTDGLEEVFDSKYCDELTTETFDSAVQKCCEAEAKNNAIGKVVYEGKWSIAMKVSANSISQLDLGNTVYIRIPSFGSARIKCSVQDIRKNGKESILVLSSSIVNENILTLRYEEIHLIVESFNGVQIRQSALRKLDGKDGVYVKVGLLLKYKEVEILYNDGTTAIVKYDVTDNDGIRIYDQVVYKGSNLYDGKAVSDG